MKNIEVGKIGESLAVSYLKKHKYKILETNYKNSIGEIDIVAKQKDTIIFVEVKMRSTLNFGSPREAVSNFKQQKIRNVASVYLKSKQLLNTSVRFDCIEIIGSVNDNSIQHLIGCF